MASETNIPIIYLVGFKLCLTVRYKRSADLIALYFQFPDMLVNIQFVQIKHFSSHYAYTVLYTVFIS